MEPAVVKKIFDPYFTTKSLGEGTGMGLSVVHGIVSSLGGSIAVQSVVGKGTSFEVYIPANPVALPGEVKGEVCESGGTGRILFVDDEEVLTDLGKKMLEKSGYSVVAVTGSRQALELFRKEHASFDLILTDMNMPHLDGLALIRKCRELAPRIFR